MSFVPSWTVCSRGGQRSGHRSPVKRPPGLCPRASATHQPGDRAISALDPPASGGCNPGQRLDGSLPREPKPEPRVVVPRVMEPRSLVPQDTEKFCWICFSAISYFNILRLKFLTVGDIWGGPREGYTWGTSCGWRGKQRPGDPRPGCTLPPSLPLFTYLVASG